MSNFGSAACFSAGVQALVDQGAIIEKVSTIDGFPVILAHVGQMGIASVVCTNAVLNNPTSPLRLRGLYRNLDCPKRRFVLIPEPGSEKIAHDVLDEALGVTVLSAPPSLLD